MIINNIGFSCLQKSKAIVVNDDICKIRGKIEKTRQYYLSLESFYRDSDTYEYNRKIGDWE